jgi:hypothetical protein
MSLEYAHEAAQQGDYAAAQAWALVSMADDVYSILELLREMRWPVLASLPPAAHRPEP